MKIVVPIDLVPDLVEEVFIDESGAAVDMTWARLIVNELDDHAVEQAILLKEKYSGEVILLAPDLGEVDDALFAASAKGADRLIKLQGDFAGMTNHAYARCLAEVIQELQPDLVLKGIQAHNDLDGQVGGLLAEYLGFPYVGYVAGVRSDGECLIVKKEYPGGLVAEMSVLLPAVLGIQAAESPPRYIAYSKIRQASQTANIEQREVSITPVEALDIARIYQPEIGSKAKMITGSPEQVAEDILSILKEASIV